MIYHKYSDVKEWADKAKDKLGEKIDEGIKETVIYLNCLGYRTIASCEGHLGRYARGPYIFFDSKFAEQMNEEENRQWKKGRKALELFCEKNKRSRQRARKENLLIINRIIKLLSEFYENRIVDAEKRIVIEYIGFYLSPRIACQGSDYLLLEDRKILLSKLKQYQAEFNAFKQFIKNKYNKNNV